MPIKIYQVDAFCRDLFSGNPAAVCPLGHWPEDALLQHIAAENNLPETAFYVKVDDHFRIRWFTPTIEVDLCGHATLAAAYVLFNYEQHAGSHIVSFVDKSIRSVEKIYVLKRVALISRDPPHTISKTKTYEEIPEHSASPER